MSSTPKTWPAQVRTTINPTERVSVTEREYLDLARQGLLFEGNAQDAKKATEDASGEPVFETFTAKESITDPTTIENEEG